MITWTTVGSAACAVALRGEPSINPISPNMSPALMVARQVGAVLSAFFTMSTEPRSIRNAAQDCSPSRKMNCPVR
ncbi:hypothetical protein BAL199_08418 [alpha proteobacterium BAL199]|nr:hypothetical protein BAL199_08418 [alpha proteobacterium BAL199]